MSMMCVLLVCACSGRKLPPPEAFSDVQTISVTADVSAAGADPSVAAHFREVFEAELGGKGYGICASSDCVPDADVQVDVEEYAPPEASFEVSAARRDGEVFFRLGAPLRDERRMVARVSRFWPWRPVTILLLPARDVVQGGKFHSKSAGTGDLFDEVLAKDLQRRTSLMPRLTQNADFDHRTVASAAEAQREAQRLGVDYYAQFVLGEFRNAAPMTYRKDFLELKSGAIYRASNGEIVWKVGIPLKISGNNLHTRNDLVEGIAHRCVDWLIDGYSDHVHGSRAQIAQPGLPDLMGVASSVPEPARAVSPSERLRELKQLRDEGVLSEGEYQEKRKRYLDLL